MALVPRSLPTAAAAVALALLAGCAGTEYASGGPAADAGTYKVGDRWVYHAEDGFRVPVVWDETREVTSVDANGIAVRVTQKGPNVDNTRTEQLAAAGVVRVGALFDAETRRFMPPLDRFAFPLVPGKSWRQWLDSHDESTQKDGRINHSVRVGGWEKVTTPAGTFDAVKMRVTMLLDDDEFWRDATYCNYYIWYAPAIHGIVREEKDAQYREKSDPMDGMNTIRSQHAVVVLTSFTAGR